MNLLSGRGAHADWKAAFAGVPPKLRGIIRPDGLPYSAWELLEHLRIAQWDILEFSRDPNMSFRIGHPDVGPATPLLRMRKRGRKA